MEYDKYTGKQFSNTYTTIKNISLKEKTCKKIYNFWKNHKNSTSYIIITNNICKNSINKMKKQIEV